MNKFRRETGMFLALCVMCVGLYISNQDFLTQPNIISTVRQIVMLATLGTGMAFVIITGGIDLSVGSIVGLTGVLIAKISSSDPDCYGKPLWVGIAVALAVALLLGLFQGLLITRLDLQPFIVTLGGMLLFRGCTQMITNNHNLGWGSLDIPNTTQQFPDIAQNGIPALIWGTWDDREGWAQHLPHWLSGHGCVSVLNWINLLQIPTLIYIVTAIVGVYLLHFTVFGRYVFAIGGNRDAARYSGVNVKKIETSVYVLSAGLAGVAGVAFAAYFPGQSQTNGVAYELYAIAGAVLGGCSLRGGEGSILGILIGSTVIQLIHNGFNMLKYPFDKLVEWSDKLQSSGAGIFRALGRLFGWLGGEGRPTVWHPNENSKEIVFGAVILTAVILDQIAHIIQAKRRTRKVITPPPPAVPAPPVIAVPT